jgi:hypothetical protein
MTSRVTVYCILLLASSCARAGPAGRIGDAEVREAASGGPCFTISEREERRGGTPDFDAVTVSDAGSRKALWKMRMPASRTFPVTFSMCIPYAGRVQALPQTPAARLETGKVYQVRIDARPGRGGNAPLAYDARFCLARQRDGSVLVHHIGRDDHEGRHLYGCLAPRD